MKLIENWFSQESKQVPCEFLVLGFTRNFLTKSNYFFCRISSHSGSMMGLFGDEWTLVAKEVVGIGLLSHSMKRGERHIMHEDEDPRKRNWSFTIKAVELNCEELYSLLVFAINTYWKAQEQFLWKVTSILSFSCLFLELGQDPKFRFPQVLNIHTLIETHFKFLMWGVRRKAASPKNRYLGIENQLSQISR